MFRKIPVNQAIGRARKVVAEKESRSPLKKNEPAGPGPPPSFDASEPESSKTTVDAKTEVKPEIDEGNVEQQKNSTVSPKSSPSTVNVLPLLQGPVTEYSRRMYKRIYGVCPLQAESNTTNDSESDTNVKVEFKHVTKDVSPKLTTVNKTNLNETKSPGIATQLQEQVKEFIKLGTNSISKPPLRKSPPKNMTETSPGSVKIDTSTKHTKNEPDGAQQLVIYYDGKESNSQEEGRSNIDMNETISNILTNQRNGLYTSISKSIEMSSNCTKSPTLLGNSSNNNDKPLNSKRQNTANLNSDSTVKANNLNLIADSELSDIKVEIKTQLHDSNKRKPNRLMANLNKRVLSKSVISPVTFGKLVSPEISKLQTSSNTPENKKTKCDSSTIKDSAENLQNEGNEVSSLMESNNSFETSSSDFHGGEKKHFLTALFGESPLKLNDVVQVTVSEKYKVDNGSSLPQNVTVHPDPSAFQNIPMLDSDDPEDLVIDSTACSRNTSPRVSESCEKDGDNAEHTSTNPCEKLPLRCAIRKQSECSKISSSEKPLGDITKSNSLNEIVSPPKPIDPNNKFVVNGASDVSLALAANDAMKTSQKSNPCLPDLSDCFSLEGKSQPETEPKHTLAKVVENNENDMLKSAGVSQSVNLPNENNTEFCGYLSHSSSSEVNSVNNSSTNKTGEIPISNVKRFIPSPSQLSLVSALRHSESSVFNIAEDTAGFVSALTRVRDISPIRTPDKKKNHSTSSDSQLKASEVHDIGNNSALISPGKMKSIPFATFQNGTPVEINLPGAKESAKTLIQSMGCQSSNLDESQFSNVQSNFFDKLKDSEFTCIELENGKFKNCKPSSTEEKHSGHEISTANKPSGSSPSNDTSNIFKRSRPVRRVVLPNLTKRESSEKCNNENLRITNAQSSGSFGTTETKPPDGAHTTVKESEEGQNIVSSNAEKNCQEKNINTFKPAIFKTGDTSQTEVVAEVPNNIRFETVEQCNDNNIDKITVSEVSSLSKKFIITSPSNCEKKTFKRSVSLKTMPKPLPKINYDILNRHVNKEDKCLKQKHEINNDLCSNQKYGNDLKFKNKKQIIAVKPRSYDNDKATLSPNLKSDINKKNYKKPTILIESLSVYKKHIQETSANKELEQSPHIANINKKNRVSSFQRIQSGVKIVKESKDIIKNMGKPCQKKTNVTRSLTGNSSHLSCKISKEVSSELEYPINNKQIPEITKDLKRNSAMIKMCKSSEQEVGEVPTRSSNLNENKISKPTCQSISFSQSCESQSKRPNPPNKGKFESNSKGFNEIHQQQIVHRKLTHREQNNKPTKSIENPQSKVLKQKNINMDDKNNFVRSLSNSLEENMDHIRRSHSSSPEVRSRSEYVKKQERTESKSPQPSGRSKSCLQSNRLQSKSREIRERSISHHLKRSLDDSCNEIHHDPKLRSYYVQRRSRSRSRETGYRYPRKSERSSRSRYKNYHSRHSPKNYVARSRSRSAHSYDRYKRRIGKNENQYYKQSSCRSPYLTRKRKSRSFSPDSLNHCNELKRSRQSNRNSSHQQHSQSPNRIIVSDRKQTPKKRSENPASHQESLIKLESLEKKFSFLTNKVDKKVSQTDNQLSQKPKTSSFLDEIEEIKKEMLILKSQLKKEKLPSKDNEIVPRAKIDQPENSLGRVSLTNKVPKPSLNNADTLSISKRTDDSSCSHQLHDLKSRQEVPENNLAALPNTVSVQSKPIPVIKYVKRRSRNLGDSDVTVVSSSTKLSKTAAVTSGPEVTTSS